MKKYAIPIIIFAAVVIIIIMGYIFLQKELVLTPECTTDNDCKLIYSNCDCEATSISDPRNSLVSNEICKWNICYGTNVTVVCRNNKCARSDQ